MRNIELHLYAITIEIKNVGNNLPFAKYSICNNSFFSLKI